MLLTNQQGLTTSLIVVMTNWILATYFVAQDFTESLAMMGPWLIIFLVAPFSANHWWPALVVLAMTIPSVVYIPNSPLFSWIAYNGAFVGGFQLFTIYLGRGFLAVKKSKKNSIIKGTEEEKEKKIFLGYGQRLARAMCITNIAAVEPFYEYEEEDGNKKIQDQKIQDHQELSKKDDDNKDANHQDVNLHQHHSAPASETNKNSKVKKEGRRKKKEEKNGDSSNNNSTDCSAASCATTNSLHLRRRPWYKDFLAGTDLQRRIEDYADEEDATTSFCSATPSFSSPFGRKLRFSAFFYGIRQFSVVFLLAVFINFLTLHPMSPLRCVEYDWKNETHQIFRPQKNFYNHDQHFHHGVSSFSSSDSLPTSSSGTKSQQQKQEEDKSDDGEPPQTSSSMHPQQQNKNMKTGSNNVIVQFFHQMSDVHFSLLPKLLSNFFWNKKGRKEDAMPPLHLPMCYFGQSWSLGTQLLCVISCVDAMFQILMGLLFGLKLETTHQNPLTSSSFKEFWGERWNQWMSALFRNSVFLPICRAFLPPQKREEKNSKQEKETKSSRKKSEIGGSAKKELSSLIETTKKEKNSPGKKSLVLALASFSVFLISGILHWGMGFPIRATWSQMNRVFAYFMLHWLIVSFETTVIHRVFSARRVGNLWGSFFRKLYFIVVLLATAPIVCGPFVEMYRYDPFI